MDHFPPICTYNSDGRQARRGVGSRRRTRGGRRVRRRRRRWVVAVEPKRVREGEMTVEAPFLPLFVCPSPLRALREKRENYLPTSLTRQRCTYTHTLSLSLVHHGNSTFSRTISHTFYLLLQNFLTSRVGGGGLFPQLSSKFVR